MATEMTDNKKEPFDYSDEGISDFIDMLFDTANRRIKILNEVIMYGKKDD